MFKCYVCDDDCESYFFSLFNSLHEGFLLCKAMYSIIGELENFKILEFNNSFSTMFTLDRSIILRQTTIKEIFTETNSKLLEVFRQVILTGKSIQCDLHIKQVNKHIRLNIINPKKGQLISLFNDITGIVKADEAFKKHSILFENAKDILLYLKSDGSIIDANKMAVEKYGYSREELLDMKFSSCDIHQL